MTDFTEARRHIVAAVVATEVPPDAPLAEFKAVIDVIRNRAASGHYGGPAHMTSAELRTCVVALLYVVMAKNQFSAVCREDYWRRALAGEWLPQHVARCFDLLAQDWPDTTQGALYYFSPVSMQPTGREPPWAAGMTEIYAAGVRKEYFRFFKPKD